MTRTHQSPNYIYVATALLFIITAIAGFAPTSIGMISDVSTGARPSLPFVFHFHAVSMSFWLLLLLAQSTLMFFKQPALHKKLGLLSLVLAPCILISMVGMEIHNAEANVLLAANAPVEQAGQFRQNTAYFLLIHAISFLLFPVFFLWAILVRQKDHETHKRMMILATVVLMLPAFGRLISVTQMLPSLGLSNIDARHFYTLLLLVPAVAYDIVREGRPHRAYVIGLSLMGAWVICAHFLLGSSLWLEITAALLGV